MKADVPTRLILAEVAPDLQAQSLQETYTYTVPDGVTLSEGDAVLVPFGGRTVPGYVLTTRTESPKDLPFDPNKLRPIQSAIHDLSLPKNLITLLDFLAREYLCTLGSAVSAAMPPGVRTRLITSYRIVETQNGQQQLSTAQKEALCFIKQSGGTITQHKLAGAKEFAKTTIRSLLKAGVLEKVASLPKEKPPSPKLLRLGDQAKVDKFLASEGRRKPAQAAVILAVRESGDIRLSPAELKALTSVTDAVIAKLLDAGLLVEAEPKQVKTAESHKLTNEQRIAADAIEDSIKRGDGAKLLLHGITGSGKTEVYMRAVAQTLSLGKQVLYLVPEIALTAHVISLLRDRFGSRVSLIHSGLSDSERLRQWRRARSGEAPLVLGARSAIFAPLENIGLVIVDEEHEPGYKQDHVPRYHTRTLAQQRAQMSKATLVLGSATPSLEAYYATQTGASRLLTLTQRATRSPLPEVSITDLRETFAKGKPSIIGDELRAAIDDTLRRKEQIILFINRRAYATSLLCRDCGHVPTCPKCSVSLTFHRAVRKLQCHHCGFHQIAPDVCPKCASTRLRPLGIGTEKVEETVRAEFPSARIARLDRDVARKKGVLETTFSDFRHGALDILVGTQIIAKGLDFPNVSLVGVVAADTSLYIPDFRSTERTFQLLTQVAGRSGRHKPGKVVIQTFHPTHPAIRFGAAQDYADFYRSEIEERREANYPPFVRLINIVASSESRTNSDRAINNVYDELSRRENLDILGPTECVIERLHGKWRRHVLVKLPPTTPPNAAALPKHLMEDRSALITVDVDPLSLL